MAFPPAFLDEIRARVPLAELVGRKVRLVKRGREHSGLCPFHNEKTPSFTVSEDKGFYHCFGCGAHGDAIGFVMRTEGLAFPEAVERLASLAGLEMPVSSAEEQATARRRAGLLEVLEAAAAWFESQLREPGGAEARAYLERRGVSSETTAAFRLGFAPDKRGLLRAALNARGLDDAQLAEAGLIKRAEGESAPRDYFFNRIVFPITDRRGRVIAFGGRALGDSPAKYLNSPETPLFHKGRVLYNLARARQAARDAGELIVVEGYMDVIALAQAGFAAAVAPLGTALTEEQILELWRLAEEPVLCLDGDEAGRRAGYRAAERALTRLAPGRSLRFALLPAGEDPDSLVRHQGARALRAVLESARPLSGLIWALETQGRRFDTPERQAGLIRALGARLEQIADPAVRTAYREALDRSFQAAFGYPAWGGAPRRGGPWSGPRSGPWSPGAGWRGGRRGFERFRPGGGYPVRAPAGGLAGSGLGSGLGGGLGARPAPDLLARRREQVLLAALVNHPELVQEEVESLAGLGFTSGPYAEFCGRLLDLAAGAPDLDTASVRCHLTDQGFSGILAEILRPEVYVHGRFARREGSLEEARRGVREILAEHRRRRAAGETAAAERHLAEVMTDEALSRLEARQRSSRAGDTDDDAGDGQGEAERHDEAAPPVRT
ncbi:MAG TPA: DNA primase [Kiloniellales bacterium]|nr:DNA primase [Kiloniellales bacterium]